MMEKIRKKMRMGAFWVIAVFAFLVVACSEEDQEVVSVSAPELMTIFPADSSTDVNLDTQMSVAFSESMDPSTVTVNASDTTCSGTVQVSADDFVSCVTISSAISTAYPYLSFTFQAAADLNPLTPYKIKVTRGAKDRAGDKLASEYQMPNGFTTTTGGGAPGVTLAFFDTDMDPDQIAGDVIITKADDESAIDEYRLYWGSGSTEKLSGQPMIQAFTADGSNKTMPVSNNTDLPAGATYVILFTVLGGTETGIAAALDIPDGVVEIVKDINTGSGNSYLGSFVDMDGVLYFGAFDSSGFFNLWRSDGTGAGTYRVNETNRTDGTSGGEFKTAVAGSTLFFSAASGDSSNYELWKSDGTDGGTALLHEIEAGIMGSQIQMMTPNGNNLFFRANDGTTTSLYGTDGTTLTTVTSQFPQSELVELGGSLYFNATCAALGAELCKSDGTAGNVAQVKNINTDSDPVDSFIGFMMVFDNQLFFSATDSNSNFGAELWKSDGTTAGTERVTDIAAGGSSSDPMNLKAFNGELFFAARSDSSNRELWKTDGTGTGTSLVKQFATDGMSIDPRDLTVVNDQLFMVAAADSTNRELWKSDGTGTGTSIIDINAGGESDPKLLTPFNGDLFFIAAGDAAGIELWRSDGTVAGSVRLTNINSSGDSFNMPYSMQAIGGNLFFGANDGNSVYGQELWRYYLK